MEFTEDSNQENLDKAANAIRQISTSDIDRSLRIFETFFGVLGLVITWLLSISFNSSIKFYAVAPWYITFILSLVISHFTYKQFNKRIRFAFGDVTVGLTSRKFDVIMSNIGFHPTGKISSEAEKELDKFFIKSGPNVGSIVNRAAIAMISFQATVVSTIVQIFAATLISYYFL